MKHWNELWRNMLNCGLVAALLLYTLLPVLGNIWHEVVPEHEHWLLAEVTHSAHTNIERVSFSDALCAKCLATHANETLMHTFNPSSLLQSFMVVVALGTAFMCLVLPTRWTRWMPLPLRLKSASLPLLDPPPVLVA
jgi:hypothetical protein